MSTACPDYDADARIEDESDDLLPTAREQAMAKRDVLFPPAEKLIADAQREGREQGAHFSGVGIADRMADAYELAILRSQIRDLCATRDRLLDELQTAVDESCNQYHLDGNAARVAREFAIVTEAE